MTSILQDLSALRSILSRFPLLTKHLEHSNWIHGFCLSIKGSQCLIRPRMCCACLAQMPKDICIVRHQFVSRSLCDDWNQTLRDSFEQVSTIETQANIKFVYVNDYQMLLMNNHDDSLYMFDTVEDAIMFFDSIDWTMERASQMEYQHIKEIKKGSINKAARAQWMRGFLLGVHASSHSPVVALRVQVDILELIFKSFCPRESQHAYGPC